MKYVFLDTLLFLSWYPVMSNVSLISPSPSLFRNKLFLVFTTWTCIAPTFDYALRNSKIPICVCVCVCGRKWWIDNIKWSSVVVLMTSVFTPPPPPHNGTHIFGFNTFIQVPKRGNFFLVISALILTPSSGVTVLSSLPCFSFSPHREDSGAAGLVK